LFLSTIVVLLFFTPWLGARTSGALPVALREVMKVTGVAVLLASQRWLEGSTGFLAGRSTPERSEM
jgi:hypothetical protein